ncbi:hypothetical protein ACSMX9_04420 [Streptomyces sp. LE64]|uniref:hypothetical protein n=1 Tax=Streptomyces sp. LE64 TaxID=3448653 RepID=UPI004042784E
MSTQKPKGNPQLPGLLLYLRPSGSLRVKDGTLLLTRGQQRFRIPLEAVQTLRTNDDGGALEIVLTSGGTTPGTVYRCESRNLTGLAAFADAVNDALPTRGPDSFRKEGDALVEVVRPPDRGSTVGEWLLPILLATLALTVVVGGAALIYVAGPLGQAGAVLWVLGFIPLFTLLSVGKEIHRLWVRWRLRNRGITITDAQQDGVEQRYSFTDLTGKRRTVPLDYQVGKYKHVPKTMTVIYDPNRSDRAATVLPPWRLLLKAAAVVLLGPPLVITVGYVYPYQLIAALFL